MSGELHESIVRAKIIEASERLDELFRVAKESWLRNFKFDIATEDWLKKSDARYGITKFMDFLLRLIELEYWERKLLTDKAKANRT